MPEQGADPRRRRFLTAAASTLGGVGTVAVAWPFIASMEPSARAQAAGAPVEMDVAKIEMGQLITAKWRGKPVWVVHRGPDMLARLEGHSSRLRDPNSKVDQQPPYCQNRYRSIEPEYLVLIGICTHLGCSPTYRPKPGAADLGADWPGGFFCPCHGSRFDLAGRVFEGVPAPTNLVVPPYRFLSDTRILVGESPEGKA